MGDNLLVTGNLIVSGNTTLTGSHLTIQAPITTASITTTTKIIATGTDTSTSSITGTLQIPNGGIGVAGNSFFGGAIQGNTIKINSITSSNYQNTLIGTTDNNTWFGTNSLQLYGINNRATNTCAFGYNTLNSNTIGNENTALGSNALSINTIGNDNTAIGYNSLINNTVGNYITSVGYNSGANEIKGSNNTYIGSNTGRVTTNISINNSTAIGTGATLTQSNQIVLGTSSETVTLPNNLSVTNNITYGGTLVHTSDRRLKEDITHMNQSLLPLIKELEPVEFKWKESEKRDIGFIAQDYNKAVNKRFPQLEKINTFADYETIDYIKMVVLLTKAVQELTERLETLESTSTDR